MVKKSIQGFVVTPQNTIVKADLESDLAPLASRRKISYFFGHLLRNSRDSYEPMMFFLAKNREPFTAINLHLLFNGVTPL